MYDESLTVNVSRAARSGLGHLVQALKDEGFRASQSSVMDNLIRLAVEDTSVADRIKAALPKRRRRRSGTAPAP